MHCVSSHRFPLYIQVGHHFLEYRDLIGFLVYFLLPKNHAAFGKIRCNDLQSSMRLAIWGGASYRLSIHSDEVAFDADGILHHCQDALGYLLAVNDS